MQFSEEYFSLVLPCRRTNIDIVIIGEKQSSLIRNNARVFGLRRGLAIDKPSAEQLGFGNGIECLIKTDDADVGEPRMSPTIGSKSKSEEISRLKRNQRRIESIGIIF